MNHAENNSVDVAIIGGGFTGTTLAVQLLRKDPDISVAVIEKYSLPGRGVAYGTQFNLHLLNVPAKNMSAFADDPEHFYHWARDNYDYGTEPDTFVPRRVYGQYIESLLRGSDEQRCEWRQDEALAIELSEGHAEIRLRNGPKVIANSVVLATGNFRPGDPPLAGKESSSRRYVSFAWSAGALEGVEKEHEILLIGSGLTSVDLALALRARDFRGTVHILSRRGVIPEWHEPVKPWPSFWDKNAPRTTRGLLRLIRQQVRLATAQGSGWRAVIDSLRPHLPEIWQSLPENEKRRFLRHLRPYWEVHRHRVSAKVGGLIMYQVLRDDLKFHAGRVIAYEEHANGVRITYRDRLTGKEEKLDVDRVINCTGPETDCRRLDDPLITSLVTAGAARPDPLFLGLDVDADGALLDCDGKPSNILYTVGPTRKGHLWETTAVPEIRVQVADMARLLISRKDTRRNASVTGQAPVQEISYSEPRVS